VHYKEIATQFLDHDPTDFQFVPYDSHSSTRQYAAHAAKTRKLETDRRHLSELRDNLLREVNEMEVAMGIMRRWETTDDKYIEMTKYLAARKYHRALDELQRLVVQRLFELHKLNLAQTGRNIYPFFDIHLLTIMTGYKARTHIAKSLQKRCKAIQNAVREYNAAALSLDPPRPTVDWSAVSHYHFIEEFSLLRDTHQDIRSKPWAQPVIREMMKRAQRIARAHEEVIRCNVELQRLQTWIRDEDTVFTTVLEQLKSGGQPIYYPVMDFCTRRRRVNMEILLRIMQTQALEGFTGSTTLGTKKGLAAVTTVNSDASAAAAAAAATATATATATAAEAAEAAATLSVAAAAGEDVDSDSDLEDDDLAHDFDKVMDFILAD
jgi:hypothetical protein